MALVLYMSAVVLGIVAGALPAYGRGYQRGRREERALWMATRGTFANSDGVHERERAHEN